MPWQKDDTYSYSIGELKQIAAHYEDYGPGRGFNIIEYKADFDMALTAIGRGYWDGRIEGKKFGMFKGFGRRQQMIIADIFGISNSELWRMGFYSIGKLRYRAYTEMANHLNGGKE